MYEDNEACIKIALQEACKHKTKHIEKKVHYFETKLRRHTSISFTLADVFIKRLGRESFLRHQDVLLLRISTTVLLP